MMDQKQLRWIEIQFYFILFDIWKIHNNFRDILDFIRCVRIFDTNFNESKVCSLAQDALINGRLKMNSAEYLILSWINYVPLKAIQKYKKIHNLALGREIKHYMEDPDQYYFYPRNPEEDVLEMQKFLDAIDIMKGAGITWTIKFTKRFGHYSNRSDPKHSQ